MKAKAQTSAARRTAPITNGKPKGKRASTPVGPAVPVYGPAHERLLKIATQLLDLDVLLDVYYGGKTPCGADDLLDRVEADLREAALDYACVCARSAS